MIGGLSERLKIARIKSNVKQLQVAERIGVQKSTMSGYERGSSTPSPEILMKLADIYGVSVDYLLGAEKKTPLYVDGLSDAQSNILYSLAAEFKRTNEMLTEYMQE